MNKVLMCLTAVLALSSCGLQNQVDELKNKANQADANYADSSQRELALQQRISAIELKIKSLQLNIFDVRQVLSTISSELAASNTTLEQQSQQLQAQVAMLQFQQATALIQLAALQGAVSAADVIGTYNPCGVQSPLDEVFLKLSNGRYLASFSDTASGLNTRFVILPDGNFSTTDGFKCKFSVSGNGTVISNAHN